MSGAVASGLAAALLALAAAVAGWPRAGRRARQRRVLAGAAAVAAPSLAGRARELVDRSPILTGLRRAGRSRGGRGGWSARLTDPGPLVVLVAAAGLLAMLAGGPVAAALTSGYGAVAARSLAARQRRAQRRRQRAELLDLIGEAAADLRAGLPPETALRGAGFSTMADSRDRLAGQVRSAVQLAARTGAPLAEVLGRVEADARSADRAGAASSAQVAGARATVWMLASLPAGGIGLGYAIGAEPLPVLLRTPIGAACALGALVLQLAGLGWSARITRPAAAAGA